MDIVLAGACTLLLILLLATYVRINDQRLSSIPARALAYSPIRCNPEDVLETANRLAKAPISIDDQLPPKTGRRYIVIGGAGFLGGWIVLQLLQRGEDPKRIRVLDLRFPTRKDLTTGQATQIQFIQVDISDAVALHAAFAAPWPQTPSDVLDPYPNVTVIHTAANIRFYERHISLVPSSAKVNVQGTQNIIDAALSIGASTLIYTSSGSVAVRSNRFFLWPWQKEPKYFVQTISDSTQSEDKNTTNNLPHPKNHPDFFSNYAYTKNLAEQRVRAADKTSAGFGTLRTGCLRPGNGVFGPGGDMLCGAYLVRRNNPSWIGNIVSNFMYVENCAVAHLCYEARLIELEGGGGEKRPDIGGQAFNIADPGPPPTYGDVYNTIETLTNGETFFPDLSPTLMLFLAYLIEFYYLSRYFFLTTLPRPLSSLFAKLLPAISGDLINLQPSLWNLVNVHLIFDDSRARLPGSKGGLGYRGAWTTLEGLHKVVEEHRRGGSGESGTEGRSKVAGISIGGGFGRKSSWRGNGAALGKATGVGDTHGKVQMSKSL